MRLRFAGPALVSRLVPALAHVATAPVPDPALTIRLWDSHSTGTTMPRPPWGILEHREQGKIRGFFGDRLYTVFEGGAKFLSVLDVARDRGMYWVRRPEHVESADTGSPLRTLLHLWLREHDVQLVHGGAVGSADGCVLIVGSGGAGKSSAALACLPSELGLLADDYCLMRPGDSPTIFTLYSSAKTNSDTLARLALPRRRW